MSEYANYQLQSYIRGGMRYNPNYVPKKRPRINCPHCSKPFADIGLSEHIKAKHPTEGEPK